jgi:hypothetical protein
VLGNIVFDEESFSLKTKKRDINQLTVVSNDDKKKLIGYGQRASRDKWSKDETELFFKVCTAQNISFLLKY